MGTAVFTLNIDGENVFVGYVRRLEREHWFPRRAEDRVIADLVLETIVIPELKRILRIPEEKLRQVDQFGADCR